ncbi:MAG: hypothetical protein V1792_02295 [Pseudomonadota bacterium]
MKRTQKILGSVVIASFLAWAAFPLTGLASHKPVSVTTGCRCANNSPGLPGNGDCGSAKLPLNKVCAHVVKDGSLEIGV